MIKPYKKCKKCGALIVKGDLCEDCIPLTNADKIRQMTDEELAERLRCNSCLYHGMPECEKSDCEYGIIAWLRKEADEDAGTD